MNSETFTQQAALFRHAARYRLSDRRTEGSARPRRGGCGSRKGVGRSERCVPQTGLCSEDSREGCRDSDRPFSRMPSKAFVARGKKLSELYASAINEARRPLAA